MKVNHNMSAVITNKQLLRTENKVTEAMERLSSGLKINHSKDNPAGMAISNKLNLQIEGLDQASQNASDGISVLQTTDGALNEVTSLIQRMRELSVQAASDSNTPDDKKAIQQEVEELKKEINRVSKDTEFNTKSLLDGSIQRRVYGTNATRMAVSSNVTAADYTVTINQAAETAKKDADTVAFNDMTATIGASGKMKINSSSVEIEATDTYEQVFEKIRTAGELGETTVKADGGNKVTITDRDGFEMSFLTKSGLAAGSTAKLEVTDIGTMDLQVGANENQTIKVDIPEIDTETLYLDDLDVTTVTGADRAIVALDNALARVSSVRSAIGACENRLDSTVGSLDETSEDMTSALSRISDVDMAEEMTNYTQQNVLSQAAISVLSQANDIPQQVLQLLQ